MNAWDFIVIFLFTCALFCIVHYIIFRNKWYYKTAGTPVFRLEVSFVIAMTGLLYGAFRIWS